MNSSPPAVTRLVNGLEERLGLQLLNRTTRRVTLTEAGTQFLADASRILSELEDAEGWARATRAEPNGVMKIAAPESFGRTFVRPVLCEYLGEHATVSVEALFVDRPVDIVGEGFDAAFRIGEMRDSSLMATKVGIVRRVTVAAPGYLGTNGKLETPEDFVRHRIIHSTGMSAAPAWHYIKGRQRRKVQLTPSLAVNAVDAAIGAAVEGFGIARVLSFEVSDALASGALVEVLAAHEDGEMPVHLIHSDGRRATPKIRAFVDLAVPRLRAQSDRIAAR